MKPAIRRNPALIVHLLFVRSLAVAQLTAPCGPSSSEPQTGTLTDLFIMFGSDFVRPGLAPKANYNIGLGHTFAFLKKDPIGDEITFGYTYENGGSHGFLHTPYGAHTEALGIMKNFGLPKIKTCDRIHLGPGRHHHHDRKPVGPESLLRRRVARLDRSFQRSPFHLDSGNVQ